MWYPVYDQYLAWFGLIWGLSGWLCPTTGLDGQFHSLTLQLEKKRAIILLFFTIFDFSSIGGQFGPNWPFWTPFFLVSYSWGLPIAPLMGLSSSDILSTTRKFLPAQNSDFWPGWHTPMEGPSCPSKRKRWMYIGILLNCDLFSRKKESPWTCPDSH